MDKFIKEHTVSNYECDKYGNLKIISVFHLLQDMADCHAEILNIGYTFCKQNNTAWIGRAYHIKIKALPKNTDRIILETWPSQKTQIIATREFLIKDINGNVLICASSQWAMIDTIKLRPIRFDKYGLNYDALTDRAVDTDFNKIQQIERVDLQKQIQIRQDDIDTNKHVNNCVYPMWAMETFSSQFKQDFFLDEMEINFKKPTVEEDEFVIAKTQNNSDTNFTISIGTQEKESALIKVNFKKK